jgi:predicted nuclease of predicted toxin-antitoxin system
VRLLADECVDAAIVARLRLGGHDVMYVAGLTPGVTDDEVLKQANADERILVTADTDFGELVFRLRRVAFGVLLVRLPGLPSANKRMNLTRRRAQMRREHTARSSCARR